MYLVFSIFSRTVASVGVTATACGPDLIPAIHVYLVFSIFSRTVASVVVQLQPVDLTQYQQESYTKGTATPYLVTIFQKGLYNGQVPKDWKMANVTATFKKGEKCRPSNYWPVSLTCICCKIQEHISPVTSMSTITDCQHEFRARRSCETQLLTLNKILVAGMDKKLQHDLTVLGLLQGFQPCSPPVSAKKTGSIWCERQCPELDKSLSNRPDTAGYSRRSNFR